MTDFLFNIAMAIQITNLIIIMVSQIKKITNIKREGDNYMEAGDYVDRVTNKTLEINTLEKIMNSRERCAVNFVLLNELSGKKIIFIKQHRRIMMENIILKRDFLELIEMDQDTIDNIESKAVPFVKNEMDTVVYETLFLWGLFAQVILVLVVIAQF